MRPNVGKKIKNSQSQLKIHRFQKRRVYFDLFTFEKFWNLKLLLAYKFTHQPLQGRFSHLKKL